MSWGARSAGLRADAIAALLLLPGAASRLMGVPAVLPGPAAIARTIASDLASTGPEGQSAYLHIGITLARIAIAFAASMLVGTAIGLAMGISRTLEGALRTIIPLLLTMPTILM